jgi:YD repeat-containing protein
VLALPEGQERFSAAGASVVGGSIDEFRTFLRAEYDKFGRLVRETGMRGGSAS